MASRMSILFNPCSLSFTQNENNAILSIEGGSNLAIFLGLQATDLANADFTFV
ncbi:MAG: hypothetical protein EBE86_029120 [Hormoscilla sp. GUM202]|nr:hypothetical protein [Hormoscilla sp. GUM202]